ncbi:MAG: alpha/beta fold hydrolase [Rhodospirillaceae bacterium]|nr:alpha/beta fold hydrolase [Rhodospirillaceae bacterium]
MSAVPPFKNLSPVTMHVEGIPVGGWQGGRGFPLLLIHGSGPGASSIGNWRLVLDDLASRYKVLAIDLIGFGSSGRKPRPPYFDFDLWVRQAKAALDGLDASRVGIIGHSISGAIALKLAASDARIIKVMTTGSMGTNMPVNPHLSKVWRCPKSREDMRAAAQVLICDRALITDDYLDARMAVIGSAEYQAYFDEMFAEPFAAYIAASSLDPDELARIPCDTLMLHGRDDLPFPANHTSVPLSAAIRNADLHLLAQCSHSVAMERTQTFLASARSLFG